MYQDKEFQRSPILTSREMPVTQDFSASAPLTFQAREFFVVQNRLAHQRMFSNIPCTRQMPIATPEDDSQTFLKHCSMSSRRSKVPPTTVENHSCNSNRSPIAPRTTSYNKNCCVADFPPLSISHPDTFTFLPSGVLLSCCYAWKYSRCC